MVAIVFQHQSVFAGEGWIREGSAAGRSGASANGANYGGDVHLHWHGLDASGNRMRIESFLPASGTAGGGYKPVKPVDRKEYDMRVYANVEVEQAWVVASEAKGTWQRIPTAEPWLRAAGQEGPIRVNNAEWEALKGFYLSGAGDYRVYAPIEGGAWRLLGPGMDHPIQPGEQAPFERAYGTHIAVSRAEIDILRTAFAA